MVSWHRRFITASEDATISLFCSFHYLVMKYTVVLSVRSLVWGGGFSGCSGSPTLGSSLNLASLALYAGFPEVRGGEGRTRTHEAQSLGVREENKENKEHNH